MAKRWILLGLLALGLGLGVAYLLLIPDSRPVLVDAYKPPRLVIAHTPLDLGTIAMDRDIPASFQLINKGGDPLVISKVEPSCGCTLAKLSSKTIAPGQSATLSVMLDTRLKLGAITKTIDLTTNDPQHPHAVLTLTGTVEAPKGSTHNGRVTVKDPLVLFKGECRSCHVDKGVGKTGQALFIADCGMCHGADGGGGVAPALTPGNYEDAAYVASVRKTIAGGSPANPSMGPYSQSKGGPLTDSQIDSLVTFLKYQHEQLKVSPTSSAVTPAVAAHE